MSIQDFNRVLTAKGYAIKKTFLTEVQVQEWTKINRTPNEYYFIFDTRDKIPNEYNVDIKVYSSGEVNTYKKTLTFQIVNKK